MTTPPAADETAQQPPRPTAGLSPARRALLRGLRPRPSPAAPRATTIVPVKPDGARPPLLVAPPVSGSAYWYARLARLVHRDQPILAFQSPGLDGSRPPLTSIGEIADEYVAATRSWQPRGPYLLAGYSMGGSVVVEMAARLTAAGEPPRLALLVDSSAPDPAPPAADEVVIRHFVHHLFAAVDRDPAGVDLDPVVTTDGATRTLALLDVLRAAEVVPDDVSATFLARRYGVFRANMHALQAYAPTPYEGRLVTVRAAASDHTGLAWQPYAGSVREIVLPGDHYSIWSAGSLPALARVIDEQVTAALAAR